MLQVSQRPLAATSADMALFVDRSSAAHRIRRALDLGLNSLVLGRRGSGKTSLLRRLEWELGVDQRIVYVDGEGLSDPEHLLARVAARATDPQKVEDDFRRGFRFLQGFLEEIPKSVVLLDDVPSGVAHETFGRHRDELWELPLVWIVAGNEAFRPRYLAPPADSFFDAVVMLPDLSSDEAAELLTRRVTRAGPRDESARRLQRLTDAIVRETAPATPRAILAAARSALLSDGDDAGLSVVARLQAEASQLGRPAAMLLSELLVRGPVSASDADLLAALGWTRPRAVQVLKQLESNNLVVTSTEGHGPGRPRTLYSANVNYGDEGGPRDGP